ncbi:helix-turn-helix domain-containing protein [Jiangella gansuensis]|nr:helix-turn-helix domain-containing protein [Jiangella gansuensis]
MASIAEISRDTGLTTSTVRRMLSAMADNRLRELAPPGLRIIIDQSESR